VTEVRVARDLLRAKGLADARCFESLSLSPTTVRKYMSHAITKVSGRNRLGAAASRATPGGCSYPLEYRVDARRQR
jgi:hypothetical protein